MTYCVKTKKYLRVIRKVRKAVPRLKPESQLPTPGKLRFDHLRANDPRNHTKNTKRLGVILCDLVDRLRMEERGSLGK